ncbi:hypothetical protein ACQZ4Q_01630 [Agrobacterium vitis]
MGGMKDILIQQEENERAAVGYLVNKGILTVCEHHGTVYGGSFELEADFWPIAMADRKRGKQGPVPWAAGLQPREYTDLLKGAYEDHCSDSCGYCDKLMDE